MCVLKFAGNSPLYVKIFQSNVGFSVWIKVVDQQTDIAG